MKDSIGGMDDVRLKKMATIRVNFLEISTKFLANGNSLDELEDIVKELKNEKIPFSRSCSLSLKKMTIIVSLIVILLSTLEFDVYEKMMKHSREKRCLLSNNYFVWEFTRPLSSCDFCRDVDGPIILKNSTRRDFAHLAYSSRPIIVKNAAEHWQARKIFDLQFFRHVYENVASDEAYETLEDDCQFLQFKSHFYHLRDVLERSEKNNRPNDDNDEDSWYVGWKNCHHSVLDVVNRFYENPHFLPQDAEIPATNYIFLGYEQGAVMHLDYIPRLMWQAQILGRKTWTVAPTPECEDVCGSFDFTVDTGDIVLLDTRIWYHGTHVDNGLFSLSITSEYG